jgi:hypothetical protein
LQGITLAEMVHPLAAMPQRLVILGRGTGSAPQPQV